jgi:hypothetical protein
VKWRVEDAELTAAWLGASSASGTPAYVRSARRQNIPTYLPIYRLYYFLVHEDRTVASSSTLIEIESLPSTFADAANVSL